MKLTDTFMSSPICVKSLKYQCIQKNFLLLWRQFFSIHNLEADNFFSQLQLANNFFKKKVTPPPNKKMMVCPLMFRSSLHKIQTLEVNELALNKDDDKRITIDGVRSLARGHFQL